MCNCSTPPRPALASLLPSPALFSTDTNVWHTGTVHLQRKLPEGRDCCPFCSGLCLQHPAQRQAWSRGSVSIGWMSDSSPAAPSVPAITGMCDYLPLPSSLSVCTRWKATSALVWISALLIFPRTPFLQVRHTRTLCPAVAVSLYWIIPFHIQTYPNGVHFLKK